ncbi:hypothetical protein ACJMK2_044341, partial [Sinanodonta woodiana]
PGARPPPPKLEMIYTFADVGVAAIRNADKILDIAVLDTGVDKRYEKPEYIKTVKAAYW